MYRRTAHRRTALAATALGPLLLGLWSAAPARAHGAPTDPASRVHACSPRGGADARSAACRAAVAANGAPFTAWDNLRVANVDGRDRQVIPDGELCSGGLPEYKGLDLARSDWPATRVSPGGTLTMTYVSTIPHTGTFKLFLTKPGYDPSDPLTWSDLPERPFAQVTDPKLTDGAYRFTAKLPSDRTGRQLLYTIWQNSSTPDTYYACSDVVFPAAAGAQKPTPSAGERASSTPSATAAAVPGVTAYTGASASAPAADIVQVSPSTSTATGSSPVATGSVAASGPTAPLVAGGAAAVLVLSGGAALVLRLR